jgi:glutaconate CoA-transferase subunit A
MAGIIQVKDATCPALHAAFQAAEKGVPFMPLRGVIGSDILAHRPDWKVIDNPFAASGDPIVLLPALQPDIAVFHAVMADPDGNVWVGKRRELATIAHAARRVLVTVERMTDKNLLEDDRLAPGTISGTYVDATALAERGTWPIALLDEYGFDAAHMAEYAKLARSEDGFRAYLERYVLTPPARAAAE